MHSSFAQRILFALFATAPAAPIHATLVTWTNGTANNNWSTAGNWNPAAEPTSVSEVLFPLGLPGTITTTTTENALSLRFEDNYTLSGGTLALASGNSIETSAGVTATILNALTITGGLTKTGTGTLILGGSNTNAGGSVIEAGKIRAQNVGAMGASGALTTIMGGATLEIGGISLDRPVLLKQGAILAGAGNAASINVMTVDAAATLVHLATSAEGDVFTIGNGTNDLTGGTAGSVIQPQGPGIIRLGAASNYAGSWLLDQGRLEIANATALGSASTQSVTLSGGTLSARVGTTSSFTGSPGNNVILSEDSTLLSDRTSLGSGLAYTFGTLEMGGQTLTIAPGPNAASGTASINFGTTTLTGNPNFQINTQGANGRLELGIIAAGATPRTITKSGPGELALTGGATALAADSSLDFSGGGTLDLIFPDLGTNTTIAITAAQNPLGQASLAFSDGTIRLLANGASNSTAQTYQIPTAITLTGTVTLDPLRRSNAGSNKTYEFSSLTLTENAELSISGLNAHGIRLSGALLLEGDAVLSGASTSNRTSLLTLDGGISAGMADQLEIRSGTSPLNLILNAASTYGGGTTITGGNVTVNAANALGTGPVQLNGGILRVNGPTPLADNAITVNGGTLDVRNNMAADFTSATLTISGASTLSIGNNGSGSSQVINFPDLHVSGTTTLTVTNANSFIPSIANLSLSGDLTLSHGINVRLGEISEDASPRKLLKTGAGILELNAASTHSGGTEVLAGVLLVKHADALGSEVLTLGNTSGTTNATARFDPNLTITNNLVVRTGSTGALTLDSATGNLSWNGDVVLQRALILNNDSSTNPSTLNGQITGAGPLRKTGNGIWILTNAANSFGAGESDALDISAGAISLSTDGVLGNAANGISLSGNGQLLTTATFSSNRTLTFNGTSSTTGIQVTDGHTLTLNSPLAGAGTCNKTGTGTLEIGPGVDSSGTRDSAALTHVTSGTLRVQSAKGLGNATPISVTSGGRLEFLADAPTDFSHPLSINASATVHVDRAASGSGSHQRHQLGTLALNANANLSVTGANGYGLTFGNTSLNATLTLANESSSPLHLTNLIANPGTSARVFTISGAGDIHVLGSMSQPSGTGSFSIVKTGAGSFRFGTSISAFNSNLTVREGAIDLNGLAHSIGLLTLGGANSSSGAIVLTGPAGELTLTNGLTYSTTGPATNSNITGNVSLAPVAHTFAIPSSSAATTEVTIDGPITGAPGASVIKSSAGVLRFSGNTSNFPGAVAVNGGILDLAKSAGAQALGADPLTLNGGTVRLQDHNQIPDTTPLSIGSSASSTLDLNDFNETLGGIVMTQSGTFNSSILATGANGTLLLAGNLLLQNNGNSGFDLRRNILITGTGNRSTPAHNGTLDLGSASRTIAVTTSTEGANKANANATIETRIINGGIIKTGSQALYLNHPDNSFAGGIQILEGTVQVSTLSSLGGGPLSFATSGGGSAMLDFSTAIGTLAGDITVSGSGTTSIRFAAPAPQMLTLSGNIDLQSTLTIDVVNGSQSDNAGALLDLTGILDDGTATSGLIKIGDGILRLASGNTYSGTTTVRKGVISVASDNALGDTDATLTLDGGMLHTTTSITSPRPLVFGANGGGLRVDSPSTLQFTSDVDWGNGTTSFHGSGTTLLSGTSSGSGGNLLLGRPIDFAPSPSSLGPTIQTGHVLSLRGDVALPDGNIEFSNNAILVLGSGDFIRPLGTGPGTFQMPTLSTVGWAAHGADRVVRIHEGDTPVRWGQTSPAFLHRPFETQYGRLALGHSSATHTLDFQSPIELNSSAGGSSRRIEVGNGASVIDAMLSGGFRNTPDPTVRFRSLTFQGDGHAEISGPLIGQISINRIGHGTLTLSGDNSAFVGSLFADENATIVIAADNSVGNCDIIEIWTDGTIDVSALTSPLSFPDPESSYLGVLGTLIGDAIAPSYFFGNGHITGDLIAPAHSYIEPGYDTMLHIGGDYTLQADAEHGFYIDGSAGLVPDEDFNRIRVSGAISLAGSLDWYASNLEDHLGSTIVFLLNDGDDPVQGQFTNLPEGAVIPIGGGIALQITYQANGDGGSVANDVGVTVIEVPVGPDLAVAASAPASVAPSAPIVAIFTITNPGPGNASGLDLVVSLPAHAEFVNSVPTGTLTPGDGGEGGGNDTLTIPLPDVPESGNIQVTVTLTAPPTPAELVISASLSGADLDANQTNNSADALVQVAPPTAVITLTSYSFDPANGTGQLTLNTEAGANYILQHSINLKDWDNVATYPGDGNPLTIPLTLTQAPEFFRVAQSSAPPAH